MPSWLSGWMFTAAGYAAAAVLLWLFIGAKSDIKAEIERCNTDKLRAVAEAENIARETLQESMDRRLRDLEAMAMAESAARRDAELARDMAESNANNAQDTIRRLMREAANDETTTIERACLNVDLPADALDGLR